ncbi:hypothetical protein [Streptomyces sp. NPDC002067]
MTATDFDALTADLIRRTYDAADTLSTPAGHLPDIDAVVRHVDRHLPAGYSGALADDSTRHDVLAEIARVILRGYST